MPASVFWVPSPASIGKYGYGTAGNLKMTKNHIVKHYCTKPFHIHIVPSALSCALPTFYCSFCLETEKSLWRPKCIPLGQKRF
ncbi:unnamed protein product [Staurois parvus]|uniref:Uncharacterized protein n=1 Tax=Staurois parvus TaxID=386267 RepID=A0ABN9AU24_9NEOB|nr:unnamed protein product [Staurois parvus]